MILQINFNLNVPAAEYQKMADSIAHAFLDVPGLSWKIWLLNPDAQEAGGIIYSIARHPWMHTWTVQLWQGRENSQPYETSR